MELANIRKRFESSADKARLLGDLSSLLRRVAITRLPSRPPAAVVDKRWVSLLNSALPAEERGGDSGFDLFAAGPYQPQPEFDAGKTMELAARWINASRSLAGGG